MHVFTLTAFALLSTLAAAQIPGLPSCAAGCVGNSFGSCGSLDVKCICSSTELLSGLSCCVSTACSAEDQEKTLQFANSLCAGQGVKNLPTAATCASGAASSTSAASGSSSSAAAATTESSSVASSVSSEASSITSSVASDATTVVSGTSSSASSASAQSSTGSATSSAAVEVSTGGAESLKSGLAGAGLGMVLAGVVAAL